MLFLIQINPCFAELEQKNIDTAIKKMDDTIETAVQNKSIPGAAVAVVYKNQVIFLKGFGVRTMGQEDKIDADTVFQLGSVSKPIASTLANVLQSQGYLDVDNPVICYLPNFKLNTKQSDQALKVKNILNHTSGVPRGGFNNMIEHFATHAELVDALQNKRTKTRVGQHYDYNNAMYSVIADIIQSTTHKTFENALSQYLLIPLNMTHTSATVEGLLNSPNRATPHTHGAGGLTPCEEYSKGYYAVAPAGGINSSARDMANFLKAQMGGYPKVVTYQALMRMQTPSVTTHGMLNGGAGRVKHPHYGLGWRVVEYVNQPLIYHGGWLRGFTNFIGFLPQEQLGIVILHNGDSKFSSKTAMKFFEAALGLPELPETKGAGKKGKGKGKSKGKSKAKKKKNK